MHITQITIAHYPPFTDSVEFDLDRRVNVFIGPNATGKSTLLHASRKLLTLDTVALDGEGLIPHCRVSHSADWPLFGDRTINTSDPEMIEWFEDWKPHIGNDPDVDAVPIISVPSMRVGMNLQTRHRKADEFMADTAWRYDRSRRPLATSVGGLLEPEHGQGWPVLYAEATEHATRLILEHARKLNALGVEQNVNQAIRLAQSCAYRVCADVLVEDDLPEHRTIVDISDVEDEARPQRQVTQHFTQVSVRHMDSRLPMSLLSSGTENTMWWMRFAALSMAHHYGFVDGWEERPAILLVDEIENHLHPTWQRRVIPALLEHFPGLQIFATTHSPFVVAGLKAGQVHLLNRDENGVVRATTNTEDIIGWTADEILRTMMGVDDPTDDATARNAAELRKLRNEGPRDTAGAEEYRQTQMQELRRLVDRDLLAGGPKARRREEFAHQFREAMERRRQEEDLSQDSG